MLQQTTNEASLEVIRMNFQEEEEGRRRRRGGGGRWNFSLFISPRHPSLPFSRSFGRCLSRDMEGGRRGGKRKWREMAGMNFSDWFYRASGQKFWFCGFSFSPWMLTERGESDVEGSGRKRKEVFFPLLEILEMGGWILFEKEGRDEGRKEVFGITYGRFVEKLNIIREREKKDEINNFFFLNENFYERIICQINNWIWEERKEE